jgi:hypothetical protein
MGADVRVVRLTEASEMVRALRARGVSLDEIAVECGASWWTVLRWMRAERVPHPDNLRKLTALHGGPRVSV